MQFQRHPTLVHDDIVFIVSGSLLSASSVVLFNRSSLDVFPLGNTKLNLKDAQHWCTTTVSRESVGLFCSSLLYVSFIVLFWTFVLSGIHNEISEAPNTDARRRCLHCQWFSFVCLLCRSF